MTTGDEKVVAEVGEVFDLRWIGSGPLAPLVNKHGVKVGDKLIPLKAYTELAAERDEWSARALRTQTALIAAESQLAELRGKCEELIVDWEACIAEDSAEAMVPRVAVTVQQVYVKDLRSTLAAADGGGTSRPLTEAEILSNDRAERFSIP